MLVLTFCCWEYDLNENFLEKQKPLFLNYSL